MTKTREIVTIRSDKSQIFEDRDPLFLCIGGRNSYTSDTISYASEHWHEDIEFLYVQEGKLDFIVNGKELELKAGEGIFVNSRRIHSNWSKLGEYCIFIYGIVHPSILTASPYIEQQYIKPLVSSSTFDYILLNKNDWTGEIIEEIENLMEKDQKASVEIGVIECAYKFIRLIYENVDMSKQINPVSPVYTKTFQSMLSFIQEHYMEKISLDEIAKAGNIGKTLCAKLFKQYVAKTPGDYLISFRIMKSMEMLSGTDMSVTEIAYSTGFTSASHYTKTFREIIGCTPMKYRGLKQTNSRYENHYTGK